MVPTATLQKVPFNTETYDVGAEYDPATGVFTPKAAGYYHVACKAVWHITAPATVVSYFETAIFLNDVRVQEQGHHGDGYYATRAVSGTFRLQAGDQVDCRVSHESGANRDLEVSNSRYTNFEAFKVAP
jgi:hypothetical protein